MTCLASLLMLTLMMVVMGLTLTKVIVLAAPQLPLVCKGVSQHHALGSKQCGGHEFRQGVARRCFR